MRDLMKDDHKTKKQLIDELMELRSQNAALNKSITGGISAELVTEETLQANRAQLSNALEIAHLGNWEYDVANDLFTFNDQFYKIFRTTVEQVGGYTMHSTEYARRFVHPDDIDVVGEETRKAVEATDPHFNRQIEHRMLYADGTVGHITVRFFIVKDSHGRTVKTYGVNQDITDRKRVEERLRLTLEATNDGIWDWNIPTGKAVFSPRYYRMLGFEPYEFLESYDSWRSLVHPDDFDWAERKINEHINKNIGYAIEIRMRTKSGDWRWILTRGMVVERDTDNRLVRMVGTHSDITERKRMEESLKRSEENFRHSLDDSPMGVRIVTEAGETIYANRAILDIYGYDSMEELKTIPVEKRYTPESHADFLGRREKRQQGIDAPSEYTINIIRKDGEVRNLLVLRSEILWDCERQFQVLYSDITERKQAEKTLKESEERYRSLVDNAHEAIYVAQDGMIKFINRAGVEIAEQSEQELISRPFIELIHPDDRAMAGERYLKRLKGEVLKSRYIFRIITKNDNIKWLEVGSALINFEGRPATLNVVTDITDRKQVEEELRISRSQLRALATRLQQIREEERLMVAREIHDEMGGGLTGLKMDLSWLLRKMGDADPCEERVALMDKIHTSNALIDQMIKVVRRISADLRPSVLDDLGLIAALSWQAQEFTSRTEIQCEFVTHIDYINLEDETATGVFRVFQEALTNVMRHSQATKVAVVLREDERSLFGDESLVLEIRDNGRGITEEEILNPESLGLLGMKERVLAFGGELSIRGEPGGGTVLVLKIPRIQGEPS